MSQSKQIPFNGKDIYLVTGRITQTVNVCTEDKRRGEYDWTVRLTSNHFVSADDIRQRTSIDDLISWLTHEKLGLIERSPSGIEIEYLPKGEIESLPIIPQRPLEPEDSVWVARAMRIVENCIDELVLEFLDMPYLHRVEHSIHTRLYSILSNQPHFDRHFSLAETGMLTQPIHKEWPETIPRPEKGNRRGNFDLAILSPGRLRTCSLKDFSDGLMAPAVAIEMGLNYKEGHLSHDAEKLLNSQVLHGYLVHLVREKPHEQTIDETIRRLQTEGTIKVAFARVAKGQKFVKLLNDMDVHEI